MEGIRKVQARRKEEMVGMANRNHSNASRVQDNKGKLQPLRPVHFVSKHWQGSKVLDHDDSFRTVCSLPSAVMPCHL